MSCFYELHICTAVALDSSIDRAKLPSTSVSTRLRLRHDTRDQGSFGPAYLLQQDRVRLIHNVERSLWAKKHRLSVRNFISRRVRSSTRDAAAMPATQRRSSGMRYGCGPCHVTVHV